jgi:hypothetical protein
VHEVHEGRLVRERRRNLVSAPTFEDEAGFSAVDANLFNVGVCEVLGQGPQRSDRRKDPPQKLFGLLAVDRQRGSSPLVTDHTSHQLINPGLVVNAHAGEVTSRQLGRELGLDPRASLLLDRLAVACGYCHDDTAGTAST